MLECVANISEGQDVALVARLAAEAAGVLLDVHSDPWHNRSVITLGGPDAQVLEAAKALARAVVGTLDLRAHEGAHPRLGVLDVVPFVALDGWPVVDAVEDGSRAEQARDHFGAWAARTLGLPVFAYGPGRPLPEVRRRAFQSLPPDWGPRRPDPRAGAVATGCRPLMVAYNLWLREPDLARARQTASLLRSPAVRALAFQLGGEVQVSFNLLQPQEVGPAQVMATVSAALAVARAELVGLVPRLVLERAPEAQWESLGLSPAQTIEARLQAQGAGPSGER